MNFRSHEIIYIVYDRKNANSLVITYWSEYNSNTPQI